MLMQILVAYHIDRDLERIVEATAQHYDAHRINRMKMELDPDTVHLASAYMYNGCYNLIREWIVRGIDKTPRQIAELLVNIVNKDYL